VSWFPVDDAFHSHPKARKAGMEAVGLWTLAGSHCMAYLTDGFVADWWVKEKPKGVVLAKRLVSAGLWRQGENSAGEQGYWFHDWKPECLKVNVLAAREKARQRKAKQRESQQESRVTDGVSPASCLVPTQPNPTQPIISVVDLGGGVTSVDAREPRPHCSKHLNENAETNCRPCMKRRKWDEDHASQSQADELDVKRQERDAIRAARESCELCDENGMRSVRGGLKRCDHQEQAHA
jgi:hypothetical protein